MMELTNHADNIVANMEAYISDMVSELFPDTIIADGKLREACQRYADAVIKRIVVSGIRRGVYRSRVPVKNGEVSIVADADDVTLFECAFVTCGEVTDCVQHLDFTGVAAYIAKYSK